MELEVTLVQLSKRFGQQEHPSRHTVKLRYHDGIGLLFGGKAQDFVPARTVKGDALFISPDFTDDLQSVALGLLMQPGALCAQSKIVALRLCGDAAVRASSQRPKSIEIYCLCSLSNTAASSSSSASACAWISPSSSSFSVPS